MDKSRVDERTPMVPLGDPGPSYMMHSGQRPFRETREKHFHCCICTGIITAILVFLVLGIIICYSLWDGNSLGPFNNSTDEEIDIPRFNITDELQLPVTFFAIFPLEDENITDWTLPGATESQVEEAIDAGKEALGDREIFEETIVMPVLNSPSFRHQKSVSTSREARIHSKRGYVEDHATRQLAKNMDYKREYGHRRDIGQGPSSKLDKSENTKCSDFAEKYRTADGVCNNRDNPRWGSAFIHFRRALNPDYCDGISQPRCAIDGTELPSARRISMTVHRPSYYTDPNFTVMLAVWGQFLDHDITATAGTNGPNGEPIECCNTDAKHPECFTVPLGPGDPYFDDYNVTCMNFLRSAPAPLNTLGPRQQLNQASAFIDGSVVYGATADKIKSLRKFEDGLLDMYVTADNRTLLPVNKDPQDGCNEADENSKGRYCFSSGDDRANENLHLTSMHLLWARHHNYIAVELKKVNPHWDDERIYQESRRILGAQMQHITYNEFLSVVIGKEASEHFGLLSSPGARNDTYDNQLNPSIANEFAAAAFRFAHTLLPGLMKVTKDLNDSVESIALHNMLFNPYSLYRPTGLDSALRSAINNSLEKSDPYFTTELTEKLFAQDASPVLCGLDLVSLNIQRGRDHGLPAYFEWRKHCRLPRVETWEEMNKAFDQQSFETIRNIYKSPLDVDIYTGALAEFPVKGGIIGPLLTCLIGDQYLRIKKGDSFWYERTRGPQKFSREQLNQIYETTLSMVICRSSDHVEYSQRYVMKKVTKTNPLERCSDLEKFSFEPWRENQQGKANLAVESGNEINSRNIKN